MSMAEAERRYPRLRPHETHTPSIHRSDNGGNVPTMGDVVNLNKYRKKKARELKEKVSQQRKLKHGLSGAERSLLEKKRELENKRIDGHKLDPESTP